MIPFPTFVIQSVYNHIMFDKNVKGHQPKGSSSPQWQ